MLVTLPALDLWQHRVIALGDYDIKQPILLALTIAEFVRTAHRDMTASRDNEPAEDGRSETTPTPVQAGDKPLVTGSPAASDFTRFGIGASVDSRFFTSQSTALFGPSVVGLIPFGERAEARVEAGVSWGTAEDTLGNVDFTCPSLSVGLDLATADHDLRLQLGPRLALGYVIAKGQPKQGAKGQSAQATIVLAGLGAVLVGRLGPRWLGWLTIEAAHTVYGLHLHADDRSPAVFSGPSIALQLGVARML